ncbi:hypothetical protein ACFY5D_07405 [Paeniglutamicibacter sp. NPDC012692]|uniref:hypothetical protein n=1 Tax=Paeniglutamicibacter sp. NPDC012692 TaxID=3364388 RepID=UPI0036AEC2D6
MEPTQQPAEPTPGSSPSANIEVVVHSAPKFWPFMGVGALVGIIIAFISAYSGPESPDFSRGSVAGFLSVGFAIAGVLLAGIVFLIVDRVTLKRGRRATAVPTGEPEHH